MKLFRLLTAILLSFLIVILAGSLYGALRVSALDTIYPNLSVDGISVGGLTRAEAVETLRANGREDSPSSPLTVTTIGGLSFTVDPALAGLAVSNEDAAALAWSYGRRDNPVKNLLTWIDCRLHPTGIRPEENDADRDYLLGCIAQQEEAFEALLGESEYSPLYEESRLVLRKGWGQLTMDTDGLLNAVIEALRSGTTELRYDGFLGEPLLPDFEAIYNELRKEPRDAVFTDDGRFEVIDEVVGCSFDIAAAVQLWEATAPAEEVSVPMEVTWPSVTGKQLRDSLFHDLLGACTTNYYNSTDNRRSNVQLCASKIDGTVLYPGDVFSYNGTVGARTEEAGFLPAPAYVDGDVKEEIGGGACQVSSTLYAATLFAFLETVERSNHIFPVHYMQLGTDATVTIPEDGQVIDFKFRNSKTHPVRIVARCDEEACDLTFEIWGTLEDDDYMPVEFDNTWGWEYTYDRVIEPARTDRPGYKIKLEHEKYYFEEGERTGTRTLTYRRVFDTNGNLVAEDLTNMLLPNGLPGMDTYYDHQE